MDMTDIYTESMQRIHSDLKKGESIRWVARASPNAAMITGISTFLFAIPWTAFAIYWTIEASGGTFPNFKNPLSLLGIPFALIGFYMLSTPLLLRRKAKRTYY